MSANKVSSEMTGITDDTTRKHLRDLASEGEATANRQRIRQTGALLRHGMNMIKNSTTAAARSGCTQGNHCRRFLTGDAAKNSAVPFAAFDTRRDIGGVRRLLPRMMAPSLPSNSCAIKRPDQRPGAIQRHARRWLNESKAETMINHTEWFPPEQKPVREGLYLIKYARGSDCWHSLLAQRNVVFSRCRCRRKAATGVYQLGNHYWWRRLANNPVKTEGGSHD